MTSRGVNNAGVVSSGGVDRGGVVGSGGVNTVASVTSSGVNSLGGVTSGGLDSAGVGVLVTSTWNDTARQLASSSWVAGGVVQVESGRVPRLTGRSKVLGLEQSARNRLLAVGKHIGVKLQVSIRIREPIQNTHHVVSFSDKLELSSVLLGGVLVLLRLLSLTRVQLLERVSASGIVGPLGVVHGVADLQELVVDLAQTRADTSGEAGNDGLLDNTGSDALDKLVQEIVLAVSDLEGQGVQLDSDILGAEHLVPSVLDGFNLNRDRDTLASDDNICDTRVGELGPTRFPSEAEENVLNVALDLREPNLESVASALETPVDLFVWGEDEVVVSHELDDVGEEVGAGKNQVLNDQVDLVVRVFSSGNGEVADTLDDLRQEVKSDIVPKVGLESEVSLFVEQNVLGETLDIFAKTLVERVIGESGSPELDFIGESLLVSLVLVGEEVLAGLDDLVTLRLAFVLEDPSSLEKSPVDVVVDVRPPLAELGVVLGVGVDLVHGVGDTVHGLSVGESLEEVTELPSGISDSPVRLELLGGVGALVGNVLGVALVVLQGVKEPSHLMLAWSSADGGCNLRPPCSPCALGTRRQPSSIGR